MVLHRDETGDERVHKTREYGNRLISHSAIISRHAKPNPLVNAKAQWNISNRPTTELPPALVARIIDLRLALDEVYSSSLEEWLDDFQRDVYPEPEVLWWERLSRSYLAYRDKRDLSAEQRQAAFKTLVNVSMGGRPEMLSVDLADLPEGAIEDLELILGEQGRGLLSRSS
jgi:hypothetical protein